LENVKKVSEPLSGINYENPLEFTPGMEKAVEYLKNQEIERRKEYAECRDIPYELVLGIVYKEYPTLTAQERMDGKTIEYSFTNIIKTAEVAWYQITGKHLSIEKCAEIAEICEGVMVGYEGLWKRIE